MTGGRGHRSSARADDTASAHDVFHFAPGELPDLGDVLRDPFAAEHLVDPALPADVGRHAAELASPLAHATKDLRHVLRADDDDAHDHEDDQLAETEAEHRVNPAR